MKADTVVEFDVALIERARKGDTKAFERLYRDHVGRVHGLCLRMTRNPDLAADCCQDAFIKAWKALPRFEARASFSTWLHRIAVNTAKNHLVAGNRRPPGADVDVEDAEQFDSGIRLRDGDTPDRELMRQQMEQTVMRAVEALPEELRLAITLREVDGLSYEEIAQRMGCPIGTVRSRIFRAREAIDQELRPLLDSDTRAERAAR